MFKVNFNYLKTVMIVGVIVFASGCGLSQKKLYKGFEVGLNLQSKAVSSSSVSSGIKAMSKGKLEKAGSKFNDALRHNFNSTSLQLLNAINYHLRGLAGESGAFELAEQGYLTAIRADKSNWEARFYLGLLYVDIQRYEEAKVQLGSYVLQDDKDPEALYYLALSSYYSGDVESAHASATRLWEVSAQTEKPELDPQALLRLLTIVKAASGKGKEANQFLENYLVEHENQDQGERLRRRIEDWRLIHANAEEDEYSDSYEEESYEEEFIENEMVAVDVVIVGTSEDVSRSTGVNLLSQLQFQFGNTLDGTPGFSRTRTRTEDILARIGDRPPLQSGDIFDPVNNIEQDTVTSLISVPAVRYNLNILNATDGTNEILARPTLVARSGQTSEFFSGVEVSAAAVSGGAGDSISIEKEIGVKLAVTPEFGPDGSVILQVQAERTFLTTPSSSVLFEFRLDTSKTTVNANVAMKYGQTLILGGLDERETENDSDGVPILRDIPIINWFFSRKTKRDFKNSVMILLTPRPASFVDSSPENAQDAINSRHDVISGQLQDRYSDWFKPLPNIRYVINQLQKKSLYRNFQSGDIKINAWHKSGSHATRLNRVFERAPI